MVTLSSRDGSFHIPEAMVRAASQHAERQADLTVDYLLSSGSIEPAEIRLPAAALLELAAVLEIGVWERLDLRRHLDVDLPTYREAANQLGARFMRGPAEFEGPNASPLSIRVVSIWMQHFAWEGHDILGAEIVLEDVEEDAFIDQLAEFVWTNHRELEHLIQGNRGHET